MKPAWSIGFAVGFIALAFVFYCYSHMEAYCFFYPSIDTQYASGYSEAAFNELTNGMTIEAVQKKLGNPLYVQTTKNGDLHWSYTMDGKCTWGDWAWFARQLTFRDGKIIEIVKQIIYN
jgi:outer membrane protein assembly factor BamE (lipoprotein component of BamABCDE complex)